ncbi:MAG TPA: glycosyltransferase family 4 protein [Rickettsiales bacterium]|nr:glycosyltransferase family 4 protein [Rickettsiales bacterium]
MAMEFLPYMLAALVLSLVGTGLALRLLRKYRVMDTPNARSNHKAVTPRGGGIAMMAVSLPLLALYGMDWRIVAAALLLAGISFVDDMRGLPARVRFLAQAIAVMIAIPVLHGRLLPDAVPQALEWIGLALCWLWFINLTNFMDGIDGITSMQVVMMAVGISVCVAIKPLLPLWLAGSCGIIAAAVLGFYWFNRSPAKLFMGDVGSIPLGFLMGYLLISLALQGAWISALILPAYYLGDATFTLVKRGLRGEKVWEAHSQHAYQQAVRAGLSHRQVVEQISLLNLLLISLAVLASIETMRMGLVMLFTAYAAVALTMRSLMRGKA